MPFVAAVNLHAYEAMAGWHYILNVTVRDSDDEGNRVMHLAQGSVNLRELPMDDPADLAYYLMIMIANDLAQQ